MAARIPLNSRAAVLITGLGATTLSGYLTASTVYAEEPSKKPIYDDYHAPLSTPPKSSFPSLPSLPPLPSLGLSKPAEETTEEPRPTPTDRLAARSAPPEKRRTPKSSKLRKPSMPYSTNTST